MKSNTKIHLAKYLKECGNYTKSQVKNLYIKGIVLVNGKQEKLSYIVSDNDIITVNGEVLNKVPLVYYIYNKPAGLICTNNKNIKNNFIEKLNLPYRVFSVGRLDKDSEGLLILTNDGKLANKLLDPLSHIEKEYIVRVKYPIDEEFINNITKPIVLRGKLTKESKAYFIDEFTFGIILKEGKYHQIRRTVIYNNNTVINLRRIRIANIYINDLKNGEIRIINKEDILI